MRGGWYRTIFVCLATVAVVSAGGCATPEKETPPPNASPKFESLMNMGDAQLRDGRFRQAMQHYMEADALDPRNADLKYRIGLVYSLYFNRLDNAIPYFQEAIGLKKDFSEAYNGLGAVYLKQKKWDEAIGMFQQAVQNMYYSTPEFAYMNMGRAYQGKGDTSKAIENYKTAIELKPQYYDPYLELGLLYQELGQHEQASRTFQQARVVLEKREPKRGKVPDEEWNAYRSSLAGVCYLQGLSLAKLSRFPEARAAYQRALEVATDEDLQRQVQQALRLLPSP